MNISHPELAQTRHYLELLDPNGIFTFQTFADQKTAARQTDVKGGGSKLLSLNRVFRGTLDQHAGLWPPS